MQRLVIACSQRQNQQINLTEEQLHYLKRVLRLKQGDSFIALDGKGQAWIAQLADDTAVIVQPLEQTDRELTVQVTLIAALPKGNSFDEIVRCCTQLGVTQIIPAISDRTLLKPSTNKLQRWRRIATEAAEQSERQIVPAIAKPASFVSAITQHSPQKYICVARGNAPHLLHCLRHKQATSNNQQQIIIATGSEGGWTTTEIEQATLAGFQSVSLGKRILRAATAPIVALSLIAGVDEEFS